MTGPTHWVAGHENGKRLGEEHHVITCDFMYFVPALFLPPLLLLQFDHNRRFFSVGFYFSLRP